ncbi:MAG: hypothetical protein V3R85_04865, partial [Alphaproteobacteria bacterium]
MEQRNLLLAVVFSVGILMMWQFLYEQPRMEAQMAAIEAEQEKAKLNPTAAPKPGTAVLPVPGAQAPAVVPGIPPTSAVPSAPPSLGAQLPAAPVVGAPETPAKKRAAVLRLTKRILIQTPRLQGSIQLKGGQIDDLTM